MKYLAPKIRILVTHQVQYLQSIGKILLLKDGKVLGYGTYEELQSKLGVEFTVLLREMEESYRKEKEIEEVKKLTLIYL